MACPDENQIAGWLSGTLDEPTRRGVEAHVDGCATCSALLAELGHVVSAEAPKETSAPPWERPRDGPWKAVIDPGAVVGRYVIEAEIGRGGMGIVYRARDPILGRAVALKLVRPPTDAREDARLAERLVAEAQALARLSHPNVVSVHDTGRAEILGRATSFLAMELVEGLDLRRILARDALPRTEVMRILDEAGEALAAAHAVGIVHRDFKPENVLVGLDGRARVVDLGLAAAASTIGGDAIAGTPAYAAPEQILGGPVDAAADQFAYAVTVYEALFGERPWPGTRLEEVRWQYVRTAARRPRLLRGTPEAVVPVLLRALSVRPEDRWPSMRALLEALAIAREREPIVHLRIHAALQSLFALIHLAFAAAVVTSASGPPSPATTSSTTDPISDVLVGGLVVWLLILLAWLLSGIFWAPLNAWGLWTRRSFARRSVLLYAGFAVTSCVGLPYAIYAFWTMSRPSVRAYLEAARSR